MWNAACDGDYDSARFYASELRTARPSTQVLLSRLLNDDRAVSYASAALKGELSDEVVGSLGQIARDPTQPGRYEALSILAESSNSKATSELESAVANCPDGTALSAVLRGSKHLGSDVHLPELTKWVCDSQSRSPDQLKDTFGTLMSGCLREISECRDRGLARVLFGQIAGAALAPPPTAGGLSADVGKCLAALAGRLSPGDREAASALFVAVASSSSPTEPFLQRVDQVRVLVALGTESAFTALPPCATGSTDAAGFLNQIVANTSDTLSGRRVRWQYEPALPLDPTLVLPLMEAIIDSGAGVPSYLATRSATLAIQMGGIAAIRAVVSHSSLSNSNRSTAEVAAGCDEALLTACDQRSLREQIAQVTATMYGAVTPSSRPTDLAYWLTLEQRLTPHGLVRSFAGCIPARLYPSPEAFVAAGFSFGELLPGTRDLVFAELPNGWAFHVYSGGAVIMDQQHTVRVMVGSQPDSPHSGISCSLLDPSTPGHIACGLEFLAALKAYKRYSDQEEIVIGMDRLPPDKAMLFLTGKAFAPGRGGHEMSRW